MPITSKLSLSLAVTIALLPAAVAAQATDSSRQVRNRLLEEVMVTAQKREEDKQNVPIAIQAFSQEQLDALGIDDAVDLPNITPGMTYQQVAGYSIIFIRGVGTNAFIPSADASIATYIDGIYFPFSHGLAQSFGAVERVEVLKGPQGTLFGRNSTGGAISVHTKKPGPDFEASLQSSYEFKFNDSKNRLHINLPVTDTVAVAFSGIYNEADHYYELTEDARLDSLPKERERGGRLRVNWAPTDYFDVTLSALKVKQTGTANMLTQQQGGAPQPAYELLGASPTADYTSSVDSELFYFADNRVYYGEANLRLDWFDIKSYGSVQHMDTDSYYDYDASVAPLVGFRAVQLADVKTAEIQLLSNQTSWGSEWLTWLVGAYYIESIAGYNPVDLTVARDLLPTELVGQVGSVLDPLLDLVGIGLDGLNTAVNIPVTGLLSTDSVAAFFQTTATITDWLDITVGARYQEETKQLTASRNALRLSDGADGITLPLFNYRDVLEILLPLLSSDHHLLHHSVSAFLFDWRHTRCLLGQEWATKTRQHQSRHQARQH